MGDIEFTHKNVIEMNERLIGYHANSIGFNSGMCGCDFEDDIDLQIHLAEIITQIINKKRRKKFKWFRKED